jgi:hypothetical protein
VVIFEHERQMSDLIVKMSKMGCSSEQVRKVTGKELNGWRSIPGNTIVLWPLRNRCDIHSASCPVTLRLKQSEREIGVRSPSDEKY